MVPKKYICFYFLPLLILTFLNKKKAKIPKSPIPSQGQKGNFKLRPITSNGAVISVGVFFGDGEGKEVTVGSGYPFGFLWYLII